MYHAPGVSSIAGLPLQLRLHLHPWPLISRGAQPQPLSMTPSFPQKQPHVFGTLTHCLPCQLPASCDALASPGHSLRVLTLRKYVLEDFSWPAVSVKQRLHFSGAGLLLPTADSSGSADQNQQILHLKYHTNGLTRVEGFSDFLLKLYGAGLHCLRAASSVLPSSHSSVAFPAQNSQRSPQSSPKPTRLGRHCNSLSATNVSVVSLIKYGPKPDWGGKGLLAYRL